MAEKNETAVQLNDDAEKIRIAEEARQKEIEREIKEATGVEGQYGASQIQVLKCWMPYVSVPVCILAVFPGAAYTIWYLKSLTTALTKRWRAFATQSA